MAVVYAVVAWLIAQIIAVVNEPLNLPDWFDTVLMVLLIIGFPIALVLTWAFEVTPEGVQPTRSAEQGGLQVMALGRSRFDYAIIGLLVVAVGWLIFRTEFDASGPDAPLPPVAVLPAEPQVLHNSIAVLPFENLSPNPDDTYFAAGMHEEVLNQLAKIKDLTVIARTTMMRYEESDKSVPEIAAELNVGAVMEGSVRYAGDRVRITTQLNDAITGAHLWSEAYDRDLEDIFAIQSDIALKITEAMKAEFSVAEQEAIAKAPTDNLEAYAHYIRALSLLGGFQPLDPAQEELDAAIALDPEFALALATKAWVYGAQIASSLEGVEVTAESQRRNANLARDYAERALAIDPDQGGAYLALGSVDYLERRWAQGSANYARAYRLNPNDPFNSLFHAIALALLGRADEAIQGFQRSFTLDPRGFAYPYFAANLMGGWGQMDAGIIFARRAVDLAPEAHIGYTKLAQLSAMNGDAEVALEMAKQAEVLLANYPDKASMLALMETYYWLQRPDDVARLFEKLQIIGETQTINHGELFQAYFALGDFDAALDHLDSAFEENFPAGGDQIVGNKLMARYYEPLWGHPRYEAAVSKLGLWDVYPRPEAIQGTINRP